MTDITYAIALNADDKGMAVVSHDDYEELRIRCDALRGLLYAECGFELDEIAAVETAAVVELTLRKAAARGNPTPLHAPAFVGAG